MRSRRYTTVEIAQVTGFSHRQLDYWAQHGIAVPSGQRSHGPGTRRLYTFDDLVCLGFVRHLKEHGWSTQKVRRAIIQLQTVISDPNPLTNIVLVDGKGSVLALCKTKEGERILLDALNPGGQQVMEIVLEVLEEETRRIIDLFDELHSKETAIFETGDTRIGEASEMREAVM